MEPLRILFLCVANSARSQIAHGLANRLLSNRAIIQSAGSNPSGIVQPGAVKTLQQIGIDISHHTSKSIDDLPKDFLEKLDFVITLCAEEVCPTIITKATRLHWPTPDPKDDEGFLLAVELISKFLIEFKKSKNL